MQIKFIKNIQFTRLVKADGRLREFNFRKQNGPQEGLFTVDVSDDRGNRIVFRLRKNQTHWQIVEQSLPQWVYSTEKTISEVITEEGF